MTIGHHITPGASRPPGAGWRGAREKEKQREGTNLHRARGSVSRAARAATAVPQGSPQPPRHHTPWLAALAALPLNWARRQC